MEDEPEAAFAFCRNLEASVGYNQMNTTGKLLNRWREKGSKMDAVVKESGKSSARTRMV